jgi:hypothetical protein
MWKFSTAVLSFSLAATLFIDSRSAQAQIDLSKLAPALNSVQGALGSSPTTQPAGAAPTTQPDDPKTTATNLITKLNQDVNAKDWVTAGTDAVQLAPYSNQLTPQQHGELVHDQAMIAFNRFAGHNTGSTDGSKKNKAGNILGALLGTSPDATTQPADPTAGAGTAGAAMPATPLTGNGILNSLIPGLNPSAAANNAVPTAGTTPPVATPSPIKAPPANNALLDTRASLLLGQVRTEMARKQWVAARNNLNKLLKVKPQLSPQLQQAVDQTNAQMPRGR